MKDCENCKFYDEDIDTQPCCSCVNKENFEADRNVGGKMESKDIIKALECCIKSSHLGECFENKCPLISEKGCKVGKETLYPYALKLIKNQQAFIKKYENIERADDKLIELQQAELETAKTEAYKEFAELSKERLTGWDTDPTDEEIEDTLDDVLQELTERKED